jgi:hypothetical protein
MFLHRRHNRFRTGDSVITRDPMRERIIPHSRVVETGTVHVTAVTLRGSLPVVALSLPALLEPGAPSSLELSVLALFLTASHASTLVHQWVRRR